MKSTFFFFLLCLYQCPLIFVFLISVMWIIICKGDISIRGLRVLTAWRQDYTSNIQRR